MSEDFYESKIPKMIVCNAFGVACNGRVAKYGVPGNSSSYHLELADEHFDAIYAFESIGYTKDLDAWLRRCWRSLKPGGRLLIRSPGSLDACRREHDYRSVTAFFENWRYNFLGANLLVFKLRRLGFDSNSYRWNRLLPRRIHAG